MSEKRTLRERAIAFRQVLDMEGGLSIEEIEAELLAVRKEALEEAANKAEDIETYDGEAERWRKVDEYGEIATAIRALAETTDKQ